jgi:3-dehydroquinate synthase II
MNRDRLVVSLIAPDPEVRSATLARARSAGLRRFAVPSMVGLRHRPGEEWYLFDGRAFAAVPGRPGGPAPLPFRTVGTASELAESLAIAERGGGVAIRWTGARVLPLESALSRSSPRTSIWVVTERPEEIDTALGALEVGADRVVVEVRDPASVDRLDALAGRERLSHLRWGSARVVEARPVGVSERVLVDTTALLDPSEGMLLGSSAALLVHVASEAEGSAFSRPRPFRVNAGSPHLYVLMADGTTRYLSELAAGDRLLVASPGRQGRAVGVGRIKVERRPMTMVRIRRSDREATIFVQEAETVRLSAIRRRVPVTELQTGEQLRTIDLPPARHLGDAVRESIEER